MAAPPLSSPHLRARRRAARLLAVAAITTGAVTTLPAAALAAAGVPAPTRLTACPDADASPATASLPRLRASVTCLLRQERTHLGAGSVRRDARLARAGTHQASQMVRSGFFGHVSPAGEALTDRLGLAGWIPARGTWDAGEILAWGTDSGATPAAFVAAWIKSPTHFSVLRDGGFDRIGVGLVRGTPGGDPAGLTAAVEFGHR